MKYFKGKTCLFYKNIYFWLKLKLFSTRGKNVYCLKFYCLTRTDKQNLNNPINNLCYNCRD